MPILRVALPKGHLWNGIRLLLQQAGYEPKLRDERSYTLESIDTELLMRLHRAQNVGPLVEEGRYDLGVTGLDWISELRVDAVELLDLNYGKVDLVVAVPWNYGLSMHSDRVFEELVGRIRREGRQRLIVASEYENLSKSLCEEKLLGVPYRFVRSYGATETFMDVADMIVDCTETGTTLRQNGWEIVHKIFESTARLIANKQSLQDKWKKEKIEDFLTLLKGSMDAMDLKLLKMNVPQNALMNVTSILPSMKSPTISKLHGEEGGYAIEVAVPSTQVPLLIPLLKKHGATDILEIDIRKVVK